MKTHCKARVHVHGGWHFCEKRSRHIFRHRISTPTYGTFLWWS